MAAITTAKLLPGCPICANPASYPCSACENISYCSKQCLQTDEPFHKHLCDNFKVLSKQPDAKRRKCIFFPHDSEQAIFVWVPLKDDGKTVETSRLIDPRLKLRASLITTNAWTGERLTNAIQLYYVGAQVEVEACVNASVEALLGDKRTFAWGGPLLALCGEAEVHGTGSEQNALKTILETDMTTLTHLVGHFIDYGKEYPHRLRDLEKVRAIRVACEGEIQEDGREQYTEVDVPRLHPLFESEGYISELSQHINMPLRIVPVPPHYDDINHTNQVFASMLLNCDVDAKFSLRTDQPAFGCLPDGRLGPCVVYLTNMQPLSVQSLKCFHSYCTFTQGVLRGMLEDDDGDTIIISRKELLQVISEKEWKNYAREYNLRKQQKDQQKVLPGVAGKVQEYQSGEQTEKSDHYAGAISAGEVEARENLQGGKEHEEAATNGLAAPNQQTMTHAAVHKNKNNPLELILDGEYHSDDYSDDDEDEDDDFDEYGTSQLSAPLGFGDGWRFHNGIEDTT